MLTTNEEYPTETITLKYKALWQVEIILQDMKILLKTRLINKSEATSFAAFLA
ncbi:hypothetical protein GMMP15_80006 [Candidatus Magnetomoraceae bacterium gMMP-15]